MASSQEDVVLPSEQGDLRRERVKLAQRAYRKRHASKVKKLEDENRNLRDIIVAINRVVTDHQPYSRDELIASIIKATDLENLDAVGPQDASTPPAQIVESNVAHQVTVPRAISDGFPYRTPYSSSSSRLSPRLDYGLWLDTDRLVRIFEPPLDIVPYLGERLHTLSGCIFWACMTYAVDRWRSSRFSQSPPESDGLSLAQIFDHSKHLSDHGFIVSLAQTRLDYKTRGYMSLPTSQRHAQNETSNLHQLVKGEYEASGRSKEYWKSPEEIEDYIKRQIGNEKTAILDDVVEGRGSAEDCAFFKPLITSLAKNFICFGDGPRWSFVYVSMTVGGWLKHVATGSVEEG